jgi:putative chitinase
MEDYSALTAALADAMFTALHPIRRNEEGRRLVNEAAPLLIKTAKDYGINTPLRLGHFIAQVFIESDYLKAKEEYASGAAYEGRFDLGNTQRGDGRRFKGRGWIQLTGYYNYFLYFKYLVSKLGNAVPNFLRGGDPSIIAQAPYFHDSAGWYFTKHPDKGDLRLLADKGDGRENVTQITRKVNGGTNGLEERIETFVRVMLPLKAFAKSKDVNELRGIIL